MSVSLEDIHSLLAGKITAGRELLLEHGLFGELGDALASIARTELLLREAGITFANQKITVNGKTDLLKLTGVITQLEITGSAQLRVRFRFQLPSDWNFQKSFDNLPRTYKTADDNEGLISLQPSILNDFSFKEAVFILQNFDDDNLRAGLNFSGIIADPAPLGYVKDLLGIGSPRLQGRVGLKTDGPPDFHLRFALIRPQLQLGSALQVEDVACQIRTNPPTAYEPQPQSCLELVGVFKIGSTKPVEITATTPIYTGTKLVYFDAQVSGLTISSGVSALIEFTGGTAADFELPDVLKLDQFHLKDFSLAADPVASSVKHIKFTVASDQSWSIVDGIKVTDLKFGWLILFPFNKDARHSTATISGTLVFGHGVDQVHFDVTASRHEGFTITGTLREGDPIHLARFIEMALGVPSGLPELDIKFLEIRAETWGDFSIDGALTSNWTLPLGGGQDLTLEQVSVSISKTGQQKKGMLSAVLEIAGTKLYVTAGVPEPGKGCVFEGGTFGDDQQLDLAAVGAYLLKTFGVDLPSSLPQVMVRKLKTKFNSATKDFSFVAHGNFDVDDKKVEITLNTELTRQTNSSYVGKFGGQIKVGPSIFILTFSNNSSSKVFVATYHNADGVAIPLKSFIENISSDVAGLVPDELRVDFKDVLFGFRKNSDGNKFLFGVDFRTKISLSDLPLFGKEIPPDKVVSVESLRLLVTSAGLSAPEIAEFNQVIPSPIAQLPTGTSGTEVVAKGLTVAATLNVAGSKKEFILPVARSARRLSAGELPAAPEAPPAPASDNVKWFVLEKSFGPVRLDKVGVQYQDSTLSVLLNAALSAAGLTLSLDGLSAGSKLSGFDPKFALRGLGIEYKNDAVEIGGALMKTGDSYDGAAVIKTKQLTISALGSYTTLENQPSLFIYAFVDYPLGGPAFFFVTGLAAGFGYNRRLIAPSVDKVSEFPLVKQAIGGRAAAPSGVMEALKSLRNDVPPSVGDIFLAIGVKFNSFKLVDSFALLTFEFGNRFMVNLLGISTAVVPRESGVTPLAQVQIAWKASYDPDEGCLAIDARLTPNSYILSKDCHLSGGYAFYSWFKGDHAGDFVQTLGGYDPDFEKTMPAHYPKVPRLAFDWRVSNSLTIQGDAYYALTGSALMAGGHLEVLFRQGELRAWLKVEANFLIAWKPYQYKARLAVRVGASYTFDLNLLFTHVRISISVDVGADLHLWGPDFSGTAHIDISVISFTIAFGANASQEPKKIGEWSTFQDSFLPKENVCSISVQNGLIRKMEEAREERWIINPKDFSLSINSAIPFKTAFSQKDDKNLVDHESNVDFGVRPMKVGPEKFKSSVKITVTRQNNPADGDLSYTIIEKAVPKGLWDKVPDPSFDPESFLQRVPSGIEIRPASEVGAGASARIDLDVFKYSVEHYYQGNDESKKYAFNWERAGEFKPTGGEMIGARLENNPARDALLKDLGVTSKVKIRANIVAGDFMSAPQIGKLQN